MLHITHDISTTFFSLPSTPEKKARVKRPSEDLQVSSHSLVSFVSSELRLPKESSNWMRPIKQVDDLVFDNGLQKARNDRWETELVGYVTVCLDKNEVRL